jgi:hypothetical protein
MGIPQIAIESEDYFIATEGDMSCRSFPTSQNACYPGHLNSGSCTGGAADATTNPAQTNDAGRYAYPPSLYTVHNVETTPNSVRDASEYKDSANKHLYSGSDSSNFQSMKKI